MTQPDTLHTRLRVELDRRLAVARAAAAEGYVRLNLSNAVGEHANPQTAFTALFNPAAVIAWLDGELETLERHPARRSHGAIVTCCGAGQYPCPEIRSLAHRLGVSVDG